MRKKNGKVQTSYSDKENEVEENEAEENEVEEDEEIITEHVTKISRHKT